jgi:hypothetical protein
MRYAIQPTPDGKFEIVHGPRRNLVSKYDTYETAKSNLEWHLHEERLERRAQRLEERAYERYEREHCND